MELQLKKQPQKYLLSVDEHTRQKLWKALEQIKTLSGDIDKLKGYQKRFRYKMDHYRIIFEWEKGEIVIVVIEINTRTNMKYRRR